MMQITSIHQLEQAAGELPLLGHTVIWRLGNTSVSAAYLANELACAGFDTHVPEPPSARVSLKRAIESWVRQRSGLASMQSESAAQRGLIRVVNSSNSSFLAFVLVREDVDFAAVGLDYRTEIRLILEKKTNNLTVLTNLPTDQNIQVEDEIRQLWKAEVGKLHAQDISAVIRECVADLGAVSLNPRGGVYFVPRDQDRLFNLKHLVENLPQGECLFTTIQVADGSVGRLEMARVIQQGLLDEVNALAADLNRMIENSDPETRRQSTVARRLLDYKAMRQKVENYGELVGIYQDKITGCLDTLAGRARALLES